MIYLRLNQDLDSLTLEDDKPYVSWDETNLAAQFRLKIKTYAVGDIIYWNGSSLSSIAYTDWDSSLGTPEAIVVIPASHMPDGKVRCVCLKGVDEDGRSRPYRETMHHKSSSQEDGLTKYSRVPTWSNTEGSTYGSNSSGYLPSNEFTSNICYSDSSAGYYSTSNMIPSLYLNDGAVNENARMTIDGGNVLTDFDGKTNTSTIINNLGSIATAANACNKYATDHILAGEWYLPAAGEIAYLITRLNTIKSALSAVNGAALEFGYWWSSSERSTFYVWYVSPSDCCISNINYDTNGYVLAFCQLA